MQGGWGVGAEMVRVSAGEVLLFSVFPAGDMLFIFARMGEAGYAAATSAGNKGTPHHFCAVDLLACRHVRRLLAMNSNLL